MSGQNTGGIQNPVLSMTVSGRDPMSVARGVLGQVFTSPGVGQCLVAVGGSLLEWYGGKWVHRDEAWLQRVLWLTLENAQVPTSSGMGRLAPDKSDISGVSSALMALVTLPHSRGFPVLRGVQGEAASEPDWTVAFQDQLVTVMPDGRLIPAPRTSGWIDPGIVPCDWDPGAQCPKWLACLDQWGQGDLNWKTLVQRMFGYLMVRYRGFQRWFLLYGKTRAGKGVTCRVLGHLLGEGGSANIALDDLAERFGLGSLVGTKAAVVNEIGSMSRRDGERGVRVLKNIVGQDQVTVERKYQNPERNVVLGCAPVLVGNEIPNLPDRGAGLTDKMVLVPFMRSWLGAENWDLENQVLGEIQGIAAWALRGAGELRAERDPTKKWPVPNSAKGTLVDIANQLRPLEAFLEEHFDRCPTGWVPNRVIRTKFEQWARENGENPAALLEGRGALESRLTQSLRNTKWGLVPGFRTIEGRSERVLVGMWPKEA